jgi:RNA-directed DNA polymerase
MKLEQAHIAQIRTAFEKMESREDLLHVLNVAKPMVYDDKAVPFQLKQLTWYANPKLGRKRYAEFKLKKKSGAERSIHSPVAGLKSIQKTLSFVLQCVYEPHNATMGFVRDKSIVDNAKLHVGNRYVYNIDLKDFFPSVDQARVWKCFQLKPFNLFGEITNISIGPKWVTEKRVGRKDIANILASLCCTEMEVERKNETGEWEKVKRNVLPQGAPTSPVITNIVCRRLDYLLSSVAKRFGLKYSRYADDITFSSMHNVYQPESEFLKELQRIITEQNFHIKESKTRLQKDGFRKEVTGLLVNEKANVKQRYIKQLRMWLYYWERYGYERASGFFLHQYITDKGHVKKGKPDMANVIAGKLDYLKMVKGNDNALYLKLKGRFDLLTGKVVKNAGVVKKPIILEIIQSPEKIVLDEIIEKTIGNEPLTITSPDLKKAKSSIPIIHNPKELVTLLKNFSINGSALKYTTHSWDAGRDANLFKDISEFLSRAKIEYNKFSFNLKLLSENLNGKIYNFLFHKDISQTGWGDRIPSKRIYFGWSSPDLLEACSIDASLNPEDYILPSKYQLQRAGKTLQKFKHVIDVFKNEIEIRDENSALLNLILQKHDTFLTGFTNPIISNLDNKTFYTDVQWLSKALDMIFENIQMRPQNGLVSYVLKDERDDAYVLEILHVNSYNTGKSIRDEKLQLAKGNFGDIAKYLKNLCDWSIESQFTEGCYRINYLTSDSAELPYKELERAEGFKHILTFYK